MFLNSQRVAYSPSLPYILGARAWDLDAAFVVDMHVFMYLCIYVSMYLCIYVGR